MNSPLNVGAHLLSVLCSVVKTLLLQDELADTRTDPVSGRIEKYEHCPSGWSGYWRPANELEKN